MAISPVSRAHCPATLAIAVNAAALNLQGTAWRPTRRRAYRRHRRRGAEPLPARSFSRARRVNHLLVTLANVVAAVLDVSIQPLRLWDEEGTPSSEMPFCAQCGVWLALAQHAGVRMWRYRCLVVLRRRRGRQ